MEQTETYIPTVVVSQPSDERICNHYKIPHIAQNNFPVSEKYNRAMAYMKGIGVDYVMIVGSDDIISTDTYLRIKEKADKGYDLVGINRIYFYAADRTDRGKMVLLNSRYMLGVCKTISSGVLDKVGWRPWTRDKNWGLDALVTQSVRPHVQTSVIVENADVFDLKTRDNINKSSFWFKKIHELQDPQKLYDNLSQEQIDILRKI